MTDLGFGTFGDRLTAIRVALGSARKPLSYRELSRLIKDRTGHDVSHETLRVYDLGERRIVLDDAIAIAKVDPLGRGLDWLAHGDSVDLRSQHSVDLAQQNGTVRLPPPVRPPLVDPAVLRERQRKKGR